MSARRDTGDAGTTLTEVVVGMTIMTIFLSVFTGAVVTLTRAQTRTDAITTSAGDVNTAFQRLDSTVRYAAGMTAPGTTGTAGSWYVEFLTNATGSSTCTQLRVTTGANGQLQRRTWTPTATGAVPTATAWQPLASRITNGAATPLAAGATPAATAAPVPFTVPPANASGVRYQQLVVQLTASTGNPPVESDSFATFSALNSTAGQFTSQCGQQGRP